MEPIICVVQTESVIPGRHRKVASPESITLGQWLWIPGSPLRGAPERRHMIRISKIAELANDRQPIPHRAVCDRRRRIARIHAVHVRSARRVSDGEIGAREPRPDFSVRHSPSATNMNGVDTRNAPPTIANSTMRNGLSVICGGHVRSAVPETWKILKRP